MECRVRHPRPPDRFTPAELLRLLLATDVLTPTPHSPLRPAVMRVSLVLLYTAGLRRGELARLRLGDLDPLERTLTVQAGKFHKVRLAAAVRGCLRRAAALSAGPNRCRAAGRQRGPTPVSWSAGDAGLWWSCFMPGPPRLVSDRRTALPRRVCRACMTCDTNLPSRSCGAGMRPAPMCGTARRGARQASSSARYERHPV